MRFVVFDDYRVGLLQEDEIVDLTDIVPEWKSGDVYAMNRFIGAFPSRRAEVDRVSRHAPRKALAQVALRAPVPAPMHLLVKGTNYAEHVTEMQAQGLLGKRDAGDDLGFFLKASGSISGPCDPIGLPVKHYPGRRFDHESEIAFVIGTEARAVPPERAYDYIFGFTLVLDITLRNPPGGNVTPVQRKSFETFSPMGPCVTTIDEVGDPSKMQLALWVNGELRQQGCAGDMLVDMPTLLSRASCVLPLRPGDVYTTGTPPGVGPLQPGDRVDVECAEIGRMSLPVVERQW
jgi:2-keto-4-pentenoate hydratase/2-oxohepta-3-ene-1,7-dioic acid hydratase in catechol pathway